MKKMKKVKDKQLVLLEALIRYADLSGSTNPHFYKDDMLKRLDVCEHVFNVMLRQLGDRYCRMVDCFGERSSYVIDVHRCLELRDQIVRANAQKRRRREAVRNTLLAASIGAFFVILVGCCII